MPLIVWLGSAALAGSFPVAWWAISADRRSQRKVSDNLSEQQPSMRKVVLERAAHERFIMPLLRAVGAGTMRFTPSSWAESRTTGLAKAGWTGRLNAEQLLGLKVVFTLLIALVLLPRMGGQLTMRSIVMWPAMLTAAFMMPDLMVRAVADRRADEITRLLPDVLDQLTISVEAGLGFEAALSRIAESDDHALTEEFSRMLQDVRLGATRADALEAMANRTQVDDLKTLVLTLRQAETLGVPLARSLRTLAAEMRTKRRFRAEEAANKLPVKMIFPLGVCILPALFIVILGPAIVRFLELF